MIKFFKKVNVRSIIILSRFFYVSLVKILASLCFSEKYYRVGFRRNEGCCIVCKRAEKSPQPSLKPTPFSKSLLQGLSPLLIYFFIWILLSCSVVMEPSLRACAGLLSKLYKSTIFFAKHSCLRDEKVYISCLNKFFLTCSCNVLLL